jgi:hypothetical protein
MRIVYEIDDSAFWEAIVFDGLLRQQGNPSRMTFLTAQRAFYYHFRMMGDRETGK